MTSGFIAKLSVFGAAIDGGQTWLVIIGVITSIILAFPYLRVVVMMWLSEPGESTPSVSIPGALTSTAPTVARTSLRDAAVAAEGDDGDLPPVAAAHAESHHRCGH